jgi:heme oxygenase
MKTFSIDQFLTRAEIDRAAALYKELAATGTFASTVDAEIITPNIERINKALGQENDPRYLAYAVEYVFIQLNQQKGK